MKLAISNIAWSSAYDELMYQFLQEQGYEGLEIAPTRLYPTNPYTHKFAARTFSENLMQQYGLGICSMQSIWYGISERVFGTEQERDHLIDYTKQAIDFAQEIHCRNLVFGCPKNRIIPNKNHFPIAINFFRVLGAYAATKNTILALEPNPQIYGTNFINTTAEAFALCKEIDNPGIKVNIDLGTLIYNQEELALVRENISLVNHIHISEPNLQLIQPRSLHKELNKELKSLGYDHFLSIEMKNQEDDIGLVKGVIAYAKEVFS